MKGGCEGAKGVMLPSFAAMLRNLLLGAGFWLCLASFTADKPLADGRTLATLWYATSAEAQACYLQGYAQAEARLMALGRSNGRQVIVTDLDETAVNNAASTALDIAEGKSYSPERWDAWERKGLATALPGAVPFFKLADALGYRICYLSNRSVPFTAATLRNLQALGLPQADSAHLSLKTSTSNKEPRRAALRAQGYEIVMLLGDNLADFVEVPADATEAQRAELVEQHRAEWGRRFIVFPNPMYGGWQPKPDAASARINQLAQPAR